jgi:hypothetical protein
MLLNLIKTVDLPREAHKKKKREGNKGIESIMREGL